MLHSQTTDHGKSPTGDPPFIVFIRALVELERKSFVFVVVTRAGRDRPSARAGGGGPGGGAVHSCAALIRVTTARVAQVDAGMLVPLDVIARGPAYSLYRQLRTVVLVQHVRVRRYYHGTIVDLLLL